MPRSADVHYFVTREGKVRARIDLGSERHTTAPRDTALDAGLDVAIWLEGRLDTEWPPNEEGASHA